MINEILKQQSIKGYYLAKATNTRFEVIARRCRNNVEKLDLDVLARICYTLDCSPWDIIKRINASPNQTDG